LALTAPSPSVTPSEWIAVVSSSARAVASLAAGSISRATINASANCRRRCGPSGNRASSPISRAMPNAAATWPCGNARTISKPAVGTSLSPRNAPRSTSIRSADQSDKFASVRFFTLAPSR